MLDQRPDWPLPHPRDTVERERAVAQRAHTAGEKSDRRAAVAAEDFGAAGRNMSALACNARHTFAGFIDL